MIIIVDDYSKRNKFLRSFAIYLKMGYVASQREQIYYNMFVIQSEVKNL